MTVARLAVAPVLILGFLAWLAHGAAMLSFPFQYDYGEGGTMIASWRLAQGESIYPDIQEPPFVVNPYTPVYLWAGSLFMGGGPTMFGGRLVSFASCAVVGALLFAWLRRRSSTDGAMVGLAVFLVHPLVLGWAPLYRTDMLALAFGMGGLVAMDAALREPSLRREGLAAMLVGLAFFTKQSCVAPMAACLAALLMEDRRRFARFTAVLATVLVVPTLVLQVATGGRYLNMVFGYNVMPFHVNQAWVILTDQARASAGAVALAMFAWGRRDLRLWWLFLGASLPIAVGSGREGGFYNYLLEMHLALAVLAGAAWSTRAVAGGLVLAQLALGATAGMSYLHPPLQHLRAETLDVLTGRVPFWLANSLGPAEAAEWLEAHPGPILAENLANPTVLGSTPWLVDPLILFTLAGTGRWDPEPMLQRVDRQEFSLIFLQVPDERNIRFPSYALRRIHAAYRVAGMAGQDYVLVPRGPGRLGGASP